MVDNIKCNTSNGDHNSFVEVLNVKLLDFVAAVKVTDPEEINYQETCFENILVLPMQLLMGCCMVWNNELVDVQ